MSSALMSLQAAAGGSSSVWNAASGSSSSRGSWLPEDEGMLAPAALVRVQVAVLNCLQGVCSCPESAAAVQGPLVWDLCVAVLPLLADSQPLALREAAAKALVAAAEVDADAVWLALADVGSWSQVDQSLLLGVSGEPAAAAAAAAQLPKLQQLLPAVNVHGKPDGDRDSLKALLLLLLRGDASGSCSKKAAGLLKRVEVMPVAWHAKAQQQLQLLQAHDA
jgi:hypothetical protein